jgi:hypothetical protein
VVRASLPLPAGSVRLTSSPVPASYATLVVSFSPPGSTVVAVGLRCALPTASKS